MKLTSAKEAARLATEAKALAEEKEAEAAEARRASAKMRRAMAALDKKLSAELLLAAAKGEASLVFSDASLPISLLSKRGFLVYEHGSYSELDVENRINDWRRHALGAGISRWIDSPDSVITLTDQRALNKLFGGAEGFANLHRSIWREFAQQILYDEDFWIGRKSGLSDYAAADLLISAIQTAWRDAVHHGDIRPEFSFKSFSDYNELYAGTMFSEFRKEAVRLVGFLDDVLTTDRVLASNLDYSSPKHLKMLNYWKCNFKEVAIQRLDKDGPRIFDLIISGDDEYILEAVGRILNPLTFGQVAALDEDYRKCSPLAGVEHVEVAWLPLEREWSPTEDKVDAKLLGWMGSEEGQTFLALMSGGIKAAAEEGLTRVEFKLEQRPGHWSMATKGGHAYASLPPTLVNTLLTGYGYKVADQLSGKQHRITVSW